MTTNETPGPYTPTTDEVREEWALHRGVTMSAGRAEFDRMLAGALSVSAEQVREARAAANGPANYIGAQVTARWVRKFLAALDIAVVGS